MTTTQDLQDVRDQLEVLVMRRNMGGWATTSRQEYHRLANREYELLEGADAR